MSLLSRLFTKANPATLAERNDIPALLGILREHLDQRTLQREENRIKKAVLLKGKPTPKNRISELFARQKQALVFLSELIRQNQEQGHALTSVVARDLRETAQAISERKDEAVANVTAMALYPLNDRDCNGAIAEMLASNTLGTELWIDLCRTQDPRVLYVLLPAIPKIQQTPHGIFSAAFEWLEYPVKASGRGEEYPFEFLISLLFDLKVAPRAQSDIQECLSKLLRPKTPRDQILAELLRERPDDSIIDGIGEQAGQILVEFLRAAPIADGVSAKAAKVLLRRGFTPICAEEGVFFHLSLRSPDFDDRIRQMGDSAAQILLPLASSWYWLLVYRALAGLCYQPSVTPILERMADVIRESRRDSMWTPQYGTVDYVDTELNKSAKDGFLEAATLYGDCARQALERFQQDKHRDVADAAKSALEQITKAKK